MTWPVTDPLVVSTQPTLGPPLFQLSPPRESSRDLLLDLELRVRALDAAYADVSARLLTIEVDRARPWWRRLVGDPLRHAWQRVTATVARWRAR